MNMWDKKYSEHDLAYGSEANDFLKEKVQGNGENKIALCLGEGEGRNALYLLDLGYYIHAVDLSTVGLNKLMTAANEKGLSSKVRTEVADITKIKIDAGAYDLVTSIWLHGTEPMRSSLYQLADTALKPGGQFILEGYTREQIPLKTGGPPTPELMFSYEELKNSFPNFDVSLLEEKKRIVKEGVLHNGDSAVVQLLATKK